MNAVLRTGALGFACASMLSLACKSDDNKNNTQKPAKVPVTTPTKVAKPAPGTIDLRAMIGRVGVAAGGWSYAANVGAEGFLVFNKGDVSVRRVGTEQFVPLDTDKRLFPGDVVRTGADATATVTLSDETVVELAEDTAVAVGDRDSAADPASGAAVLGGVARFSVSKRAQGEGAFLVFTPGGVIGTKGTTYAVGVSATGETRVGVEDGEVQIAGAASLDKTVEVKAGKSATVAAAGTVSDPAAFAEDDWGDWRDAATGDAAPEAALDVHTTRLADLETETDADYTELDKLTNDAVTLDQAATKAETAGDDAGYTTTAEERGAVIEASFESSMRLQQHTYAMLAHAYLAQQLYLRHPKQLDKKYNLSRPRVVAALLYQKKFHAAVHRRVKPVRVMYYRHHPRGRKHVAYAGVTVAPFYTKHKLRKIERKLVRKRLRKAGYRPPRIKKFHKRRKLVAGPPAVGWHKTTKAKPRKYRVKKHGWYRAPTKRRGRLITGVKITGKRGKVFGVTQVVPRGRARVQLRRGHHRGGGVGAKVGPRKVRVHKRVPGKTMRMGPGGVSVKVKTPKGVTRDLKVGPKGGVRMKVRGPQGHLRKGVKVGPGGKVRAVKRGGEKGPKGRKNR